MENKRKTMTNKEKLGRFLTRHECVHNVFEDSQISAIFDYFVRMLPGAIYYKDKDGLYLGCSDYLLSSSGFKSPADVVGKTDYDLFSPEHADNLKKNDHYVIKHDQALITEEKITLPSGETKYYEVVKKPLKNIEGKIIGIIGNSIEITNRVIAEKKLAIEKQKAEQANEMKNQFIANMEHDLRTPCSGIAEMVHLIEAGEKDPEKKELLGYVAKASRQLLEMLNGILEFDHIESGNLLVLDKKFNIRQVVEDIIAMEMPYIKNKKLDLMVNIHDDVPPIIIGDAFRTSRILINLISNAIKFTNAGYVKIGISIAKLVDKRNIILKIDIADSGIGIPTDKQNLIYMKFARVHASNTGLYDGSGLGLCIVKQFVDELGGEIEVKSELGQGTEFECLLPFTLPLLAELRKTKTKGSVRNMMTIKNKDVLDILLVEDNILAQKVAEILLKQNFSCNLDLAANGKNALELVNKKQYDLILLDIGLPDMTGCDVCLAIRENTINKNTVAVALTAHDNPEFRNDSIDAGMNDFMVKPITEEKVRAILNKFTAADAEVN